ncbi:hypothetical protein KFE25_011581 [Diacronema lutheri]|nr:hypothetical protein KFE25_011581 [Diacronema lutheri]
MSLACGVAALALVAFAEAGASTCDLSALGKCKATHSRPYVPPNFPSGASGRTVGAFCKFASAYYECAAEAGCMTTTAARECATDFTLGACDGVEICKPGAVAAGKAPRPSPSPSRDSPSPAPAPADEDPFDYEKYPPHAAFFGYIGATAALVFANLGAAYGTAKSGRGISTMGVLYPNLVMKHIIPVVMAGVLGIYGLIIAVIIGNGVQTTKGGAVPAYTAFKGFAHLGGGLACGLSGLAAGLAIGIVGDYGVRSAAEQPKLYVGMVLVLIFSEALGLYGLIVGLILTSKN